MEITYLAADAQYMPFDSGSFDVLLCCDVLEHVHELKKTVEEAARLLTTGGIYFFDTINRTAQSFIEHIFVAQEFPLTRFFPRGTHDWRQFIRPSELESLLSANHLKTVEIRGLRPGITQNATAQEIRRLKHGQINYAEFGRRLKFRTDSNLGGSYIGYAIKDS